MARRGKYGAEKRQKEIRRKARRDAKLERRHSRPAPAAEPEAAPTVPDEADAVDPPPAAPDAD